MKNKSKKGFTLVEIMIVVVIIGLLAAMAIPAFSKVRETSVGATMDNDARQIASAANQYLMENPELGDPDIDDLVGEGLYLEELSEGVTPGGTLGAGDEFTLSHPNYQDGDPVTYSVNTGRRVEEDTPDPVPGG